MSSEFLDRISKLSQKRLMLLALELNEQVEAQKQRAHEPIAVVGIGCRFPGGADSPARFWTLLNEGRDAIRDVPADRWDIEAYFDADPDAPGRMSVRNGGFLDRIDEFDAAFFGITPREALTMDPQQRLLLEVAWEALEHAGLAPDQLAGSKTGVFVGICNGDYFQRLLRRGDDAIDAYLASGSAHSVAAGRIAYVLGLQGPALSIDTACSSSLVALHAACQSLRTGESTIALCGGVNVMCSPETTIALSKAHMLAPDGRCKTFDASADGFARGEGCGVLVLKRLSDARADGDRVLALVRGTAANQDGRSGGLTVPNGPAQEAVIRAALEDALVAPSEIDYVEAHGTGTSLGDPIEVRALSGALGQGRSPDSPLWIGSVKTNIGHLESAAGMAGVMKVILSLQHERIPAHLHFQSASPHIDWASSHVTVTDKGRTWARGPRRRLAGVSSFGFSGTNAHVVIEEAPPADDAERISRPVHCVPVSARTPEALRELATQYEAVLASSGRPAIRDLAHTAAVGRSQFSERAAVVARDEESARLALRAASLRQDHPDLHRATAVPGRVREVVFLFTGQGSQYPGMARGLYESSTVFREVIDRCDALLGADAAGRTLKSVLWSGDGENPPIHETAWTQPALFAVEYGLAQVWRSWGVEPAAVMGHSVGEYVAACVAGVFSLEDGLRLIAERGRLMQALPPGGTMAAIFAPAADVAAVVAPFSNTLSIAAINAGDSVVISGAADAVEHVLAAFEQRKIKGHRLYISLAAHSPLVEPALDAMEACARQVEMQLPRIPVAWNLTGTTSLSTGAPDARYWRRHLREPVRFADGVAALHRDGYSTFLEVGPHPTLIALAQRSLPEDVLFLTSLRRGKDDWHELMTSVARLYVHGGPIDWRGVERSFNGRRVSLPTYPFERRSYWIGSAPSGTRHMPNAINRQGGLAGARLATAAPIFELVLTPDSPAYLAEHRAHGAVLVAGPVYMEMAQACAREAFGAASRSIDDFSIHQPLVVPDEGRAVQVQFAASSERSTHGTGFEIHSRAMNGNGDWQLHASGRLLAAEPSPGRRDESPLVTPAHEASSAEYYARLLKLGIDLRDSFRSLRDVRRVDGHVVARIELAGSRAADRIEWAHPALLDGALQAVGLALRPSEGSDLFLFTGVEHVQLQGPLPASLMCEARLREPETPQSRQLLADVVLYDSSGKRLGEIRGVSLRRTTREALAKATGVDSRPDTSYQVAWEPVPISAAAAGALVDPSHYVPRLTSRFEPLAGEQGMAIYDDLLPELDRISLTHIRIALDELGFDARVGRTFRVRDEAARLGIVERQQRLFARLMQILAEDGLLRLDGDEYMVATAAPASDPGRLYDAAFERFGDVDGELRTLHRCGAALARVLRGAQDPVQLLFPGGSLAEARKLYVESPYARTYNGLLAEAVQSAIASLPSDRRLRVLEIGAGTGGTTTYLLPLLPRDRVEYTFTDLSPHFLDRAAEQFASYPFVRYRALDIERDPVAQGFESGAYDIVVAANVLHATADIRKTLEHVRTLMASSASLFLLEGVAPERWVDLTFGLTDGWWRFTDVGLRSQYPLLARQQWMELLTTLGFSGSAALPGDEASSRAARQQALIVARGPIRRQKWTIVGDASGLPAAFAARLRQRGDSVVHVPPEAVPDTAFDADHVVYLGAVPLAEHAADDEHAVAACMARSCELPLHLLARSVRHDRPRKMWLATKGAMPVDGLMAPGARWQAPIWGVGRVFALEHPSHWGGLIDLAPDVSDDALIETLEAAIEAGDGEDQTAWRAGGRRAARLVPRSLESGSKAPFALRADATYMITGGFGGLGLIVARWMAGHGARHIALLGRTPDVTSPAIRDIEALGARVIPLRADASDEGTMTRVLRELDASAPPLRGIVHAAADLHAAPIAELTTAHIECMLRPKIAGTVVLERVTRGRELDFMVLFSSSTALLGAAGFAHYAAGNAFLDATAAAFNRPGRRVLSVNWGTWEVMRLASADSQRGFRESGLLPMPAADALEAMATLMSGEASQAMVADIDWGVLKPLHEARRARPLLSRVGLADMSDAAPVRGDATSFIDRWTGAAGDTRVEMLVEFVSREVAAVLGLHGEPVPLETGLFELGMDSLMSVELKKRLERGVGLPLPSTLTFNYPNVSALAGFIHGELQRSAANLTIEVSTVVEPAGVGEPIGDLDSLSDEELEARLLARLDGMR